MSSTFTERINFVQKTFGKGQISRDGNDITVNCPCCESPGKKKLAINLETWKFHCWVCGARGNTLVSLLRKHGSRELLEEFRLKYINDKLLTADIQVESDRVDLPDGFTPIVSLGNKLTPDHKAILRYLSARKISESDLWKYRIGVASDPRFSRRAVFASLDSTGDVNYFVSRAVDSNARLRYLNANYDKTSIVFNDVDIDWDKPVHIVEGIFDLIALKENGTCLLGSSLNEGSLLFKKLVANEADVILCLDNDMVKKTGRIADLLTSYGCNVKVMNTSAAKDIAEMSKEQLESAKEEIMPWSIESSFRYKISNIKSGSMF